MRWRFVPPADGVSEQEHGSRARAMRGVRFLSTAQTTPLGNHPEGFPRVQPRALTSWCMSESPCQERESRDRAVGETPVPSQCDRTEGACDDAERLRSDAPNCPA